MLHKIANSVGRFCYEKRRLIGLLAMILLIAVIVLESYSTISYNYSEENLVTELFPGEDTIVVVYDNRDEDHMYDLIQTLSEDKKIVSIQAYANTLGMPLTAEDMAVNFGIDPLFAQTLFVMYKNDPEALTISIKDFSDFLVSETFTNNSMLGVMDTSTKSQLKQFNKIVNALNDPNPMSSNDVANMLDIDVSLVKTILLFSQFKTNEVVFSDFVHTVGNMSEKLSFIIDDQTSAQLSMLRNLSDMVQNDTQLNSKELSEFMSAMGESEMLTEPNLRLLICMIHGTNSDMSEVTIPLYDIFCFLSDNFMSNPDYADFIEPSMQEDFKSAAVMIEDGRSQLVGDEHSRLVLTTTYRRETKEMTSFHNELNRLIDDALDHEFYLVGESALSHEVRNTFDDEYLFISIITAIAVFVIVCITFKSFFLPVLLVAVIECSVFAMMSVMVVINQSMFFIALILVQCILMGSMIDYAILLTTYYIETRKEFSVKQALPEVMKRAMHAVLTSGLCLVIVSFVCGAFMEGQVASILTTLGIGALCALVLIIFVLPALLALFDKVIIKTHKPIVAPQTLEDNSKKDISCQQLTFDDILNDQN
jgi:predicted RND superfamily exporter protein